MPLPEGCAGGGGARKPMPPLLLLQLLSVPMDDSRPPPLAPLAATGMTEIVSPALRLKSCCGAAAAAPLPAVPDAALAPGDLAYFSQSDCIAQWQYRGSSVSYPIVLLAQYSRPCIDSCTVASSADGSPERY